jgi:hypothetical protein
LINWILWRVMFLISASPFLVGCAGAVYGFYNNWEAGGASVGISIGNAAGIAFGCFALAATHIQSLNHDSGVLYVIGLCVEYGLGFFFGLCAAIGAFIGSGIVWIIKDVLGYLPPVKFS